jgi:hypothetical protein
MWIMGYHLGQYISMMQRALLDSTVLEDNISSTQEALTIKGKD